MALDGYKTDMGGGVATVKHISMSGNMPLPRQGHGSDKFIQPDAKKRRAEP